MPAVLSAKDLHLQFGLQKVLDAATVAVEDREKVGLVGRNGTGKSSLLKILAGLENPDSGYVSRRQGLVVSYLSQEFALDDSATVIENVRLGAAEIIQLVEKYESGMLKGAQEAELLEHLTALGAWDLDSRIKMAMSELGLPPAEALVGNLSGGERRRVALCRALVPAPDLLLLDEPTNHLDSESIAWLEQFLIEFKGACVFVTHDRYFLDRIAQRILELDDGRLYSHPGNYRAYLESKADRHAAEVAREGRRQKFLRSELEFVRAGVRAQRRKSRYRLDQYYQIASQSGPEQELDVELLFPPPPPLANVVVETRDLGYGFDDRTLFSGLTLSFEPGTCTGIVGRNGVGKTTLLRLLQGEMSPTSGEVTIGKRTVFNYVDQHRLTLDGTKSVIEEIGGNSEFVPWADGKLHVRSYLKRFLFQEERVLMRIDRLSGGERSRLLLAKILLRGGNFLILDEPTNDLDLPTLQVLEEALLDFPGCVLVVSHDRYFLDRVCDRMLVFEGAGRLQISAGNYSYYLEKCRQRAATQVGKPAADKVKAERTPPRKQVRKLSWKEERELEGLEPAIAAAEEEVGRLEGSLNDPELYAKLGAGTAEFLKDLEEKRAAVAELYARWEELENLRSES